MIIKTKDKPSKDSRGRIQLNQKVYSLPFCTKLANCLKMSQKQRSSNRDFEKSSEATKIIFGTLLKVIPNDLKNSLKFFGWVLQEHELETRS